MIILHTSVDILTTDLYNVKGCTLWYVTYILNFEKGRKIIVNAFKLYPS